MSKITLQSWLTTISHPRIVYADGYAIASDGVSAAGEAGHPDEVSSERDRDEAKFLLAQYRAAMTSIATVSVPRLSAIAAAWPAKTYSAVLSLQPSGEMVRVQHTKSGLLVRGPLQGQRSVAVETCGIVHVDVALLLRAAAWVGCRTLLDVRRAAVDDPQAALCLGSEARWALVMPVRL